MKKNLIWIFVFVACIAFSGTVSAIDVTECQYISSPGYYILQNDIEGVFQNQTHSCSACLCVESDNVVIDGNGYSLDGNNELFTQGIINFENPVHDITIKNIEVKNYDDNIVLMNVYGSLFDSVIIRDAYDMGLALIFSSDNVIQYSTFSGCDLGVYLSSGQGNNIIRNNIANGGNSKGIRIFNESGDFVYSNTIIDNSKGIALESASYNEVHTNTIINHSVSGFYVKNSYNNTIFNNYVFNRVNVRFDSTILPNFWNTTKESGINIIDGPYLGGNYWATPFNNGISQTCTDNDGDGICDCEYNITEGNLDQLPLTNNTVTLDADFSSNVTDGIVPLTVQFTDESSGSPTSWSWLFGDGDNSTLQNPVHTYESAGNYTVTLTAANTGSSDTEIKADFIIVSPYIPPVPPASITNLDNTTYLPNSITWEWTDPSSSDFDHVMIYLEGVFQGNVTEGTETFLASSLNPTTSYTIGTRTVGTTGLVNSTWVNHTALTAPDNSGPIFDVMLNEGWNIFSTPIVLESGNSKFTQIFPLDEQEKILILLGWDGSQWYIPTAETVVHPLDAYFIKVTDGETAHAAIVPSNSVSSLPARQVNTGLNLVGFAPAYDSQTQSFLEMPLNQALISIEYVGNTTGYIIVVSPSYNQPGWSYAKGGQIYDFIPFKGYWVVMENGPDNLYGFSTTPI